MFKTCEVSVLYIVSGLSSKIYFVSFPKLKLLKNSKVWILVNIMFIKLGSI